MFVAMLKRLMLFIIQKGVMIRYIVSTVRVDAYTMMNISLMHSTGTEKTTICNKRKTVLSLEEVI